MNEIFYLRLGYVALQVKNIPASVRFYVDLVGLGAVKSSNKSAWLRCSSKPYDLVLEEGDSAGLLRLGFELVDRNALNSAYSRIAANGLNPRWSTAAELSELQVDSAFRFRNPVTGLELDFFEGQVLNTHFQPTVAKILRLGHVVLNVKEYEAEVKFWVDQLGFAVSDHVSGKIAFLRCHPNPLHHSVAVLESQNDGLNHFNFMVSDIDDIGQAMNRLKRAQVPIVFGPGRHLPSGSIFLYFLDPDGLTTEYSYGMEEILGPIARPARDLEFKPETLDIWGSVPDPRFGKTGVICR